MVQAEVVKEGCSVYNRSESCPGKGVHSKPTGREGREVSPATDRFQEALIYLREQTAPTNSWAPVHEQLYLALAGVLAYKLGELALCVVRHSEVFGMEGSSSSKWH